jgi:hypothetical protein
MAARIDWGLLRGSVIALAAALAVSAMLVATAMWFHEKRNREHMAAQDEYRSISERYLNVDREALIIEERYPHFLELLERGVLGREDRLSWVESLKAAVADLDAQRLEYRIDARRSWDGPVTVPSAPFEVLASRMELRAVLWHEGDLVTLIDSLAKRARGLFVTRRCRLEPVSGERDPETARQRGTVQAQCELDWVTVDWPGERELHL